MNRPVSPRYVMPGLEPVALPSAFEGISQGRVRKRFGLGDVWEISRRFSGVVAIAVLGIAMLALALRADEIEQGPSAVTAPPRSAGPLENAAPATQQTISLSPAFTPAEPTIVYYLYATDEQRRLVMLAESIAGQEIATETVAPTVRQFYALDASTPEAEQLARDTIFEAMLLNDGRTRVLVHDVRQVSSPSKN